MLNVLMKGCNDDYVGETARHISKRVTHDSGKIITVENNYEVEIITED